MKNSEHTTVSLGISVIIDVEDCQYCCGDRSIGWGGFLYFS